MELKNGEASESDIRLALEDLTEKLGGVIERAIILRDEVEDLNELMTDLNKSSSIAPRDNLTLSRQLHDLF